ncbi:hypothetical protein N7456_011179 [Penicillium angulare]|uniref:Prolyl endopeptidase n=1 Tax=Penicillium angulare TaxID=116970 RepID=A0A9W9ETA2_9EURO|nr:hypothetical protein N7456_011179 [Penicillium angulare]
MSPQVAPYGKWDSPITAEHLATGSIQLQGVQANPSTRQIWALESRPAENGRSTIVEAMGEETREVLPPQYSAKSTIHEYGGAAFALHPNGKLIFTNHPTNGVFLLDPNIGSVETIVTPDKSTRFADFHVHPLTHEWILAIQETHTVDTCGKPVVTNVLVAIHAATGQVSTVAEGADFYQHPKFSPDGKQVCWTQWNHPDMPWTGSILYLAQWLPGALLTGTIISGQARVESICQPRWSPDGEIFFVSDKTGFWQLYRFDGAQSHLINLKGLESAEFGVREFVLGCCTYIFMDKNTIVASVTQNATSNLVLIDLKTNSWTDLVLDIVDIQRNGLAFLTPSSFAVIGSGLQSPQGLYEVNMSGQPFMELLRSTEEPVDESLISEPQHISFPRTYSNDSGSAHCWFAPPKNSDFTAPKGTLPPLLVWMHGGPTSHVCPSFAAKTLYWTSRGYAYVIVNHVGSTGYGRAYRELLDGAWGEADIADAASCVSYLAAEGLIDKDRVGIVGESAGGYAVMQALYTHPDVWASGISLYGISSLAGFAEITHKFESQYIIGLVLGNEKVTDEVRDAIYKKRSAIYHADRIKAPLLLLQGDVDTVVPVSQATQMEETMKKLGKAVEMTIFKDEGHGWHKSETIRASLQLQIDFWTRTLL